MGGVLLQACSPDAQPLHMWRCAELLVCHLDGRLFMD
jgi:hypothetical protein